MQMRLLQSLSKGVFLLTEKVPVKPYDNLYYYNDEAGVPNSICIGNPPISFEKPQRKSAFIPKELGIIETKRTCKYQHMGSLTNRRKQANALNSPKSRKRSKATDHTFGYRTKKMQKLLAERNSLTSRIKRLFSLKV